MDLYNIYKFTVLNKWGCEIVDNAESLFLYRVTKLKLLLAALERRDRTLLLVGIFFTEEHSVTTWGSSLVTTEATTEASLSVTT